MSIERELLKDWTDTTYQEPEVQLAAGPTRIELTNMAVPDTETPAFTMPGMGKRRQKSEAGQNLPLLAADAAAGAGKGLVSGVLGFAGDIESLYQGVKGIINRGGDETALQGFLRGMADKTIAPTSDEVSKWLDANVGPVVPKNAPTGSGLQKYREAAASGGEFAGQLTADPFAAVGAGKALVKGAKALPKNLPVGMSTEAVGGLESVLQPAKATAPASDIGFFSAVEQAALNIKRNSGTGQAMLNDITKGENVKADEIKWLGLDEFLKGKKNVTKQEVQDFIAANKVDVQEVQLGGKPQEEYTKKYNEITDLRDRGGQISNDEWRRRITKLNSEYGFAPDVGPSDAVKTRYGLYTLPGGENYREILLTMPSKEPAMPKGYEVTSVQYDDGTYRYFAETPTTRSSAYKTEEDAKAELQRMVTGLKGFRENLDSFKSSHFDQPNILAHIRVNDRVDADGKKMLLVEEVQSDWHQAGRDRGYKSAEVEAKRKELRDLSWPYMERNQPIPQELRAQIDALPPLIGGVPDAPMKDTWYQLALKRVLKYAADNGYERVGLTTGKQQAERFDLSKQLDAVEYKRDPNGGGTIIADDKSGKTVMQQRIGSDNDLADYIGKEAAKKLLSQEPMQNTGTDAISYVLNNADLQVGGEGMKKYYDEIYPQFLAKYGKKWDAKVGETSINIGKDTVEPGISAPGIGVEFPAKTIPAKKEPVRYIDITPEMRQSVSKGQPLFSATGLATGAGAGTMATSQQEPK